MTILGLAERLTILVMQLSWLLIGTQNKHLIKIILIVDHLYLAILDKQMQRYIQQDGDGEVGTRVSEHYTPFVLTTRIVLDIYQAPKAT